MASIETSHLEPSAWIRDLASIGDMTCLPSFKVFIAVTYVYCCSCVQEMGGYFILNGIERVVRMLIMQRRNFVCTAGRCLNNYDQMTY